jgi:hypothetical protein
MGTPYVWPYGLSNVISLYGDEVEAKYVDGRLFWLCICWYSGFMHEILRGAAA